MLDYALLKPDLIDADIEKGCRLADEFQIGAVCVRPSDVLLANKILTDSAVVVSTVAGFPHGDTTTLTKTREAEEAIANGIKELDMVLNIGKLKSREDAYVKNEIQEIAKIANKHNILLKVIFENCYLNEDEIIAACKICNDVKVDFIKTSTGFGTGGATPEDVVIMKKHIHPSIKIKASGGIKTLEDVLRYKELGCSRIGVSSIVDILNTLKESI